MPNVTLKDVAQKAGVSVSLVSKVITGRMGNSTVSSDKADKILEVAREMGYVPNNSARRLRMGKGKTIAVVLPYGEEYFNTVNYDYMDGILEFARDSDYEFITVFYHWNKKELECLRRVLNMAVDGVIYIASYHAEEDPECHEAVKDIIRAGLPIIVCNVKFPRIDGCIYYDLDEESSGYYITKYCIEQGKKDILLVKSHDDKRNNGYFKAMKDAGLTPKSIDNYPWFEIKSGYNCFCQIYDEIKPLPEAIIATCDLCAIGIINSMKNHGVDLDSILVAGVDGLQTVMSIYDKKFPTLRQPTKKMGKDVAQAMVNYIETGEAESRRYYQTEIING